MHKVTWMAEDGEVSYTEVDTAPEVGDVEHYSVEVPTFRQVVRVQEILEAPEPSFIDTPAEVPAATEPAGATPSPDPAPTDATPSPDIATVTPIAGS